MLRRMLVVLFVLSLFLAGCQSQTATPATGPAVQETKASVTQSDPFGDASPVSPETEPPAPTTSGDESAVANCTVVSREPTPGPTEESMFPPPGESDWVVGPETATMTIYEYSDFQ
jgi:PBP1b-binding outer membrane lipoprotein LpoB